MALPEKEFGHTITVQTLAQQNTSELALMPPEGRPSFSPSQCTTPRDEYDPTSSHPCSPFYSHPTTRTSFEQLRCNKVYETDLESGSKRYSMEPSSTVGNTPNKECTVWPGQETMRQRTKDLKNNKRCRPFRGLTRKQRIWTKVIIVLVFIGVAIGIGVGISKAVGGGIWKDNNQQGQIGS